ncbi:hypothetical protein [Arthrobacter sp. ISL-95]|uniref:hypothetical protein n=1 Tax=Arthrobacter sp. ISL-95 TaxID=2819116 RepID=UPI001BEC7BDB|nr:hypothetical protein [Arthrobacter sp. ISL-95]MBT2586447.1 hypothetical protein [Arthrobacter sp. ISL-95]
MSYDFRVYSSATIDAGTLAGVVESSSGLRIGSGAALESLPMFIPVELHSKYAFTIDGPQTEDANDVPPEVTAVALGIGYSYEISIEGNDPGTTPLAWRFVKKLAKATAGVAVDLQTDELWPTASSRKFAKPAKDATIDLVSIRWYYLLDQAPSDLIQQFVQSSRKYLPEALPKTYTAGTRRPEPFNGDDEAFAEAYAAEPLWGVHALATPPVLNFSFEGPDEYKESDVRMVMMDVDLAALHDPRWREALRRFFIEFADASNSFFASAEVARGFFWSGRKVRGHPSTTEAAFTCRWAGTWRGLREWPQWWTWFSGPYKDLVQDSLIGETQKRGDGIFHALSTEPRNRDELYATMPVPGTTWIPAELTFGNQSGQAHVFPEGLVKTHTPPSA